MQALLWIRIFQTGFCYLNHQLMKFMKAHLFLDISKQSTDLTYLWILCHGGKNPSAFHRLHYISDFKEIFAQKAVGQLVVAILFYQQLLMTAPAFFSAEWKSSFLGFITVPYKLLRHSQFLRPRISVSSQDVKTFYKLRTASSFLIFNCMKHHHHKKY